MSYSVKKARFAALVSCLMFASGGSAVKAQTAVTMALPAQSLLFAPAYIAVERGCFANRGSTPRSSMSPGPVSFRLCSARAPILR